jgi:hypothetical protein
MRHYESHFRKMPRMWKLLAVAALTLIAPMALPVEGFVVQPFSARMQLNHATNSRSQSQRSPAGPESTRLSSDHTSSTVASLYEIQLAANDSLNPIEKFCMQHMDRYYRRAMKIKCPFFRRRASDILDWADAVMRFLVIRHKSLPFIGPPPGWRCADEKGRASRKTYGLTLEQTAAIIRKDWKEETNKGYYITGKLNTTIYRDDCLFDGPDPDMPVRGLRKYLNVASQLFDQRESRSELLSMRIVDDVIVAEWQMYGVLQLPWHPKLPKWNGTTMYYLDEKGLIYRHDETWDMSVFEACFRTFAPSLASRLWNGAKTEEVQAIPYTQVEHIV